jgi:hypothetical protein
MAGDKKIDEAIIKNFSTRLLKTGSTFKPVIRVDHNC